MNEPCEHCGEDADVVEERRIMIIDLETQKILRDSPEDAYERELMSTFYCRKCATELGILD